MSSNDSATSLVKRRFRHLVRFRLVGLLIAAIALLPLVVSSHGATADGGDIDDSWFFEQPQTDGWHGIKFADRSSSMDTFSYLMRDENFHGKPCSSVSEGRCADSSVQKFSAILPRCADDQDANCVEDFGIVTSDGSRKSATYVKSVPTVGPSDFSSDKSLDLPAGATGELWSLPDAAHTAGSQYFTRIRVSGSRASSGKFTQSAFDVGLFAVQSSDVYCTEKCMNGLYYNDALESWELQGPGNGAQWKKTCVAVSDTNTTTRKSVCLERKAIPLGSKFFVKVRLSQSPVGWLHGRLVAPEISIVKDANTDVTKVDISGSAMSVPTVVNGMDWAKLPDSLQKIYENGLWPGSREAGGESTSRQSVPNLTPSKYNVLYLPSPSGKAGIEELAAWLPLVNDTASANVSTWGVRTLGTAEMAGAEKCITNEKSIAGIVTTNATEYSAGPPRFSSSEGTLDYQVAAPHFTSGGAVFLGRYDLLMRSDVARCIYGFTDAPVNVSVSVFDSGGTTETATTSVTESDGWLKLAAYGFTHSSPTIKVKITQPGSNGTIAVGKAKTFKALANSLGVPGAKASKIVVVVKRASAKVCRAKSQTIVGLSAGTCLLTVTSETNGKRTKKSVSLKVS